jgi:hypothetical protein
MQRCFLQMFLLAKVGCCRLPACLPASLVGWLPGRGAAAGCQPGRVLLWGRCGAAHQQQAAAVAGATRMQVFSLQCTVSMAAAAAAAAAVHLVAHTTMYVSAHFIQGVPTNFLCSGC